MKNNFTISKDWNNSLLLRYPFDKIKKVEEVFFYIDGDILKCQHFFEFNISDKTLNAMKKEVDNFRTLRFSYIDDSTLFRKLKKWAEINNYNFSIVDSWKAPRLVINCPLNDYLTNINSSQIKKNYRMYQKNKENYKFYNSNNEDILNLWNYVLIIDYDSWKKEELCDMKSLNREDLQYLPYLFKNKANSNLIVVCDYDNTPLAYSLMFKNGDGYWYAVKWGASNYGRKKYAGFYCLFHHIEFLYNQKKELLLDFWGRRNDTYDKLKNADVLRNHVIITKRK